MKKNSLLFLALVFIIFSNLTAQHTEGGDSRIYHVRDGKILFKTKDHSEVQYLIDSGEISEEDAKHTLDEM